MENLFEYYIEADDLHFKYAKGEPAIKEQEFHDYYEFVYFMKGEAFFVSKNIQQKLTRGSIVLIPKEHFHQFCIGQPHTYQRCILGFRSTPEASGLIREVMNTLKIIINPGIKIASVFEQLIEIMKSDLSNDEKTMFIRSSLVQLLIYLKQTAPETISKSITLSPLVIQALDYIDEHYAERLSVESIAKLLNVSASTLAHKFGRELNMSVYRYITKKRLIAACRLIRSGKPLTYAAYSCGFNDYSCFYRLYKKYYK